MITTAWVKLWGQTAGAVAWDSAQELGLFEFDPVFIRKGWDIAPLKMSIRSAGQVFQFPELKRGNNPDMDTFKGLPGLLADVLPDRYGNQLINVWLARQGRPQNSMNPVELLCFIGNRGMGALEFEPAKTEDSNKTSKIELDSLVEVAGKVLRNKIDFTANLDKNTEKSIVDILKIGTSAGGARPKAIIAYNETTGEVRSGQTTAPKGFEHWIIKLDGVNDVQIGESHGLGRVEMAYYLMATSCGIDMMPCKLLEENGRAHFITKRFDREKGHVKHHVQTFCAMQHFDYNDVHSFSYEQLFQTMRELRLSYPEAEQMFRRMVFNVWARNCDDHTKNFAFLLKKDQPWQLAPAYDVCHAYRPNSTWVSQHALSVNGKRQNISMSDLLEVAKAMNIKQASTIVMHIAQQVGKWPQFAEEAGVNSELRDAISATLKDQ